MSANNNRILKLEVIQATFCCCCCCRRRRCCYCYYYYINGLFCMTASVSWYQKGKTSLDLNDTRDNGVLGWKWHQLDYMQIIWHQTVSHTNTSSLIFYRPDALPDAQPTVSEGSHCYKHDKWQGSYKWELMVAVKLQLGIKNRKFLDTIRN